MPVRLLPRAPTAQHVRNLMVNKRSETGYEWKEEKAIFEGGLDSCLRGVANAAESFAFDKHIHIAPFRNSKMRLPIQDYPCLSSLNGSGVQAY